MEGIHLWLHEKIEHATAVIQRPGYQRTGVGCDPRISPVAVQRGGTRTTTTGWKKLENLRWYFENVMQCEAGYKAVPKDHPHFLFYFYATQLSPRGYQALFNDWQIKPLITMDIIMPLAMKLCLETGLNVESLWSLKEDCFQEKHELSKVPCLKYYKARSSGDKEMHLSVRDKNEKLCRLKEKQARIVRDTIALIRQATAPLRAHAPAGGEQLLFLFQGSQKSWFGQVRRMKKGATSYWCRNQALSARLQADTGQTLQLNLKRFRSTKITAMVQEGRDLFEIKDTAGQKSLRTTLGYLSRANLEVSARRDIGNVLQVIHDNQRWQRIVQPPYAGATGTPPVNVLYKTLLADCRNVFDPPAEVKKSPGYVPAQGCTRYNMCLFCQNIVVLRHHLPTLVVYQRQIRQAISSNTTALPNPHFYDRTLAVLDSILDPAASEFSPEDLQWARMAAECLDEPIDPVVYR